ncbi:MAG TPA: alanine--glyoxylate aminotransferase family protein [Thermoanaerobaculia bacterium]
MSECKFFVPGPTWVRQEILAEMTRPMIGHRSSDFRELFQQIRNDLKSLFQTTQNVFFATCSGTGLMEGALLNTVRRSVLVTSCGAFSERWFRMAQQLGLEGDHLEHPWGEAIDAVRLADFMIGRRRHYDAVTITHNETSTGVINDLPTLAKAVHRESPDTLVLVDAVSSLGSTPVLFDEWELDVCFASTQKGLALPPGLTVFAVSDRALAQAAKKSYRGTYFDFLEFKKHGDSDGTPFTPSIPHAYALARQLDSILRVETIERRWARHLQMRDLTLGRTSGYAGLTCAPEVASPSVSALKPTKRDAPAILAAMKERGFALGSGYGAWKGEGFRIGHMGDISVDSLSAMLDALGEVAG